MGSEPMTGVGPPIRQNFPRHPASLPALYFMVKNFSGNLHRNYDKGLFLYYIIVNEVGREIRIPILNYCSNKDVLTCCRPRSPRRPCLRVGCVKPRRPMITPFFLNSHRAPRREPQTSFCALLIVQSFACSRRELFD